MTTGVIHRFSNSRGPGRSYTEEFREWSGDDGRYEVVDGKRRTKWNNYSMYAYTHYHEPGHEYGQSVGENYADASCVQDLDTSGDANGYGKLLSKLTAQTRGHSFNMGVAVGEGRKVLKMVGDTALRIATAIRQVRKGDLISARRTLITREPLTALRTKAGRRIAPKTYRSMDSAEVASQWLELQYGWKPLLQDVYEAGQAFARLANGPRKTRVVVKGEFSTPYKGTCGDQVAAGGQRWAKYTRRRMIVYEMAEDLSAPRQMGLLDPLTVAWELVPYSFIADWFIPIGDYLDNLSIIPSLKGRFLYVEKTTWESSFNGAKYPGTYYYVDCAAKYKRTDFRREVLTSPPSVPLPAFKPMGKALSGLHVANAVALIRNALR